jgi:amino-acid N-acetyltransferase
MKFEFVRTGDKSYVKQLLAECALPYEDITPAHLRHFLVGFHQTKLVGALLRSLAVQIDFRGQKIASQLTKQAEAYARSHKVRSLYLLTTTAEGFFTKQGYHTMDRNAVPVVVRETTEFRSICPSTAKCMVKCLTYHFNPSSESNY